MAATFLFFDHFMEALLQGKHDFSAHTFRVALTNTAPVQTSNTALADITQLSTGNGYTAVADGAGATVTLTITETSANSGVWRLGTSTSDYTWTASGSVGPFRYAVVVNDSATSNLLVGYLDYNSSITLSSGDTFLIDAGANGWAEFTVPDPA